MSNKQNVNVLQLARGVQTLIHLHKCNVRMSTFNFCYLLYGIIIVQHTRSFSEYFFNPAMKLFHSSRQLFTHLQVGIVQGRQDILVWSVENVSDYSQLYEFQSRSSGSIIFEDDLILLVLWVTFIVNLQLYFSVNFFYG